MVALRNYRSKKYGRQRIHRVSRGRRYAATRVTNTGLIKRLRLTPGKVVNLGSGPGMPPAVRAKLAYTMRAVNLIDTTNGFAQISINANSVFDPETATGGYQPPLMDNLSAIYSRYRVIAVTVKAHFMNVGGQHAMCGMIYDDATTNRFSISALYSTTAITKKRCKFGYLTEYQGSKDMLTIKKKFNIAELEGSEALTSVNFSAATGANPSSLRYINIGGQCLVSNDMNVRAQIELVYDVVFDQLINSEEQAND